MTAIPATSGAGTTRQDAASGRFFMLEVGYGSDREDEEEELAAAVPDVLLPRGRR